MTEPTDITEPADLMKLLRRAEKEGFITDIENYIECESDQDNDICMDCPAQPACIELSEEKHYDKFKINFDRIIRPLL